MKKAQQERDKRQQEQLNKLKRLFKRTKTTIRFGLQK